MRGQAHVVFRDLQASTQALRSLQGFDFFGKEMVSAVTRTLAFLIFFFLCLTRRSTTVQKIMYGKGSSDIFAKLRGTYATAGQAGVATTDLQKSIFNAPPSAAAAPPTTAATAQASAEAPTANGVAPASQGTKRPRDEEGDEGEAPMDEDESDVSMEASSDED